MWCAACQQDVPGVAVSANDPAVCCARCRKTLSRSAPSGAPKSVPFEDLPDFIELEDWEFAETIQEAERLVRNVQSDLSVTRPTQEPARRPRSSQRPRVRPEAQANSSVDALPSKATQATPWLVLAIGLGVFVCGAALIVLSLVNQRPQLWQLGLPMVLGGQVAVLAVVIWQLDAVWNGNRATFVALHAMDEQLRQLRGEWTQLQQQGDAEEQTFYRHLAEGASPDVLLADLKDQIDVLSQHLAQARRAA